MYEVYANSTLIHSSKSPEKSIHLIEPVLTLQDSAAGSFTFTLVPGQIGYDNINRMRTTIKVKRDNKTIWTGRVITESEDFWKRRKFTCEGALSFLNDTTQELTTYSNLDMLNFLRQLLNVHNSKVEPNRRILLGSVTVNDMNDHHEYSTNYQNTWDTFKTEIFDRLNGHVRLRYVDNDDIPRLDYFSDYPNTASQEINFGDNLLDFTKNWDLSQLVTVILPRGRQLTNEDYESEGIEEADEYSDDQINDYITVESVNNGSKYVASEQALNTYGRIEQVVDFSDVDDPTTLLQLANLYISVLQFDEMQLSISALDLHYLTSSKVSFNLLDQVRCISKPHGLDRMFPISEISIPLENPSGIKYKMGTVGIPSISSKSVSNSKNILNTLANMPSFTNVLYAAKINATEIMNSVTTGYINIITENDVSQALVISNTPDVANATKLWKFNMNGLGYSRNGGQRYDLAITMDGTIVADFIKTGILSDGYGMNYWNLSTGEFSLAYNTEFMNTSGNTITVVDIVNLAQDGYDYAEIANTNAINAGTAANTANSNAVTALRKQTGADNILNGTNTLLKLISGTSSWANSTWDGRNGISANKTVIDVTGVPNSAIVKGINISNISSTTNPSGSHIVQRNVKLAPNQVYVMSCYAKGSGKLQMMAGKSVGGHSMYASTTSDNLTNTWKRYSYSFKTGANNTYAEKLAGIVSDACDIFFGLQGVKANSAQLCGFKLERGNTATDWTESASDSYNSSTTDSNAYTNDVKTKLVANDNTVQSNAKKYTDDKGEILVDYTDKTSSTDRKYTKDTADQLKEYTVEYTDRISAADRAFTKNQRKALDDSYTQKKIFDRLTNNGTTQGIWLKNNRLYLNGTYLTTGVLNAGLIKAGVIADNLNSPKNQWNIATGYFTTKNMVAANINATGVLTAGDYYKLQIADGYINGYNDGSWVAAISPTAASWNIPSRRWLYGLELRAKQIVEIRTPYLAIRNYNDNGTSLIAYTGKWNNEYVVRIRDIGQGRIEWTTESHGIEFINGIATTVW